MEFAVLGPVLAILFMGAIDISRAYFYSTTIDNCAWNGAMWASSILTDPTWNAVNGGQITTTKGATEVDAGNLNPPLADSMIQVWDATSGYATDADGNQVAKVTITYPFSTITRFPGVPNPINIVRTSQVRVPPAAPTSPS